MNDLYVERDRLETLQDNGELTVRDWCKLCGIRDEIQSREAYEQWLSDWYDEYYNNYVNYNWSDNH